MKSIQKNIRTWVFAGFTLLIVSACGNTGNPPESTPTPIPSPEEQPTQTTPIEGTTQPRDTTTVLPKP